MFDRKEYAKKYREENKEKLREKRLKKYLENKEKFLEISRNYYWNNRSDIVLRRAKERKNDDFKNRNKKYRKRYYENNKEKERSRVYKWKEENKKKSDIHAFVMYAVKVGYLKRPEECSNCGKKGKIQGHHEDYSKPLDVVWLCEACHGEKHRKI